MRRMWIVSLALGALLMFLLTYSVMQERERVDKQMSRQLTSIPELVFTTLDGKEITLSNYRGKVLLLNFWAVWCPPCKEELPIFEGVYQKYKQLGFEVVAVNTDTSERIMREFLKANGYSFTFVRPKGDLESQLRLFGLPTSYLIDKDGTVRKVKMGVYRELEKDLSEILR